MNKEKLDEHKKNFKKWFEQSIDLLSTKKFAGIPILMITFPLLERLIKDNSENFYKKLVQIFQFKSTFEARVFWKVFRHGLLHAATFKSDFILGKNSNKKHIHIDECGISESISKEIVMSQIASKKTVFRFKIFVNPILFSKKVLENVYEDFGSFCQEIEDKGSLPETIAFKTSYSVNDTSDQNANINAMGYSGYSGINQDTNSTAEFIPGHSDSFQEY